MLWVVSCRAACIVSGVTCIDCHDPHSAEVCASEAKRRLRDRCHTCREAFDTAGSITFTTEGTAGRALRRLSHDRPKNYMVVDPAPRSQLPCAAPRPDARSSARRTPATIAMRDQAGATGRQTSCAAWFGPQRACRACTMVKRSMGRRGIRLPGCPSACWPASPGRRPSSRAIVRATALSLLFRDFI